MSHWLFEKCFYWVWDFTIFNYFFSILLLIKIVGGFYHDKMWKLILLLCHKVLNLSLGKRLTRTIGLIIVIYIYIYGCDMLPLNFLYIKNHMTWRPLALHQIVKNLDSLNNIKLYMFSYHLM